MYLNNQFYNKYLRSFIKLIKTDTKLLSDLDKVITVFYKIRNLKKKIIICGNGGSAAIASHVSVDLMKNLKIQSIPLSDPSLITCFSNDYSQKNWMKKAIEHYYSKGDLVIIISSSGMSQNIVEAAKFCISKNIELISFSGMRKKNKLNIINKKGLNFWVNSMIYNQIEMAHLYLILVLIDKSRLMIKKNKL